MNILEIKNVSKKFSGDEGELEVLSDVDFSVASGEMVAVIGPSGCGKSTLLRIIAGLDKPQAGEVLFRGEKVVDTSLPLSFIFQNFALFPWLTVYDNVAFGLRMAGVDDEKIAKEVKPLILQMGLEDFEKSHPKELSGGMKQRVGIARALTGNAKVILADEPFSALDAFTAKTLRDELLDVWKKFKPTIVVVTHLVEEAIYLADRIIVMSPRPGRVEKIIENKLKRPRNMRSEEFYKMADELTKLVEG